MWTTPPQIRRDFTRVYGIFRPHAQGEKNRLQIREKRNYAYRCELVELFQNYVTAPDGASEYIWPIYIHGDASVDLRSDPSFYVGE